MGGKGWGGYFDWGFVWGCIPVNAQGAQWDCKCIPVNAQGDQRGCIVSGDGPGVQRDWVGVCVCVWGRWRETWVRVYSSIFLILYSIRYMLSSICYIVISIFNILSSVYYVESDWESRDWPLESEWGSRAWTVESGWGSRVTLMTGKSESSLSSWEGMMSRVRSLESEWVIWVFTRESEWALRVNRSNATGVLM